MTSTRVLIPAGRVQARVRELAADISNSYRDSPDLHLVCVLKGAYMFLADLVRALQVPATIDFMAVSSYGKGTRSSGEVRLVKDLDFSLEGRDVLIVEDIVDTGLTLNYMYNNLKSRSPKTIRICALLSKPSRREVDVPVQFVGFTIDDLFVVGYGLDFAEQYRNLPYIAVLENSAATS